MIMKGSVQWNPVVRKYFALSRARNKTQKKINDSTGSQKFIYDHNFAPMMSFEK